MLPQRLRVLMALVLREMSTRYGRAYMGYVWAVVEPIVMIAVLSAAFAVLSRFPPLGRSFPMFYATGILSYFFYAGVMSVVSQSFNVNKALFAYPQVTVLDAILARTLLELVTRAFVTVIVFLLIVEVEGVDVRYSLQPLIVAPMLAVLLGMGLGTINCSLFALSPGYMRLFLVVHRPMLLVSGVIFIPERLPVQIREVLAYNPVVHVVSLMRSGVYPTYRPDYIDVGYVVTIALIMLLSGLLLLRRFEGRLDN